MGRSVEEDNILTILFSIVGGAFIVATILFTVYVKYCEDKTEKKRLEPKSY